MYFSSRSRKAARQGKVISGLTSRLCTMTNGLNQLSPQTLKGYTWKGWWTFYWDPSLASPLRSQTLECIKNSFRGPIAALPVYGAHLSLSPPPISRQAHFSLSLSYSLSLNSEFFLGQNSSTKSNCQWYHHAILLPYVYYTSIHLLKFC